MPTLLVTGSTVNHNVLFLPSYGRLLTMHTYIEGWRG